MKKKNNEIAEILLWLALSTNQSNQLNKNMVNTNFGEFAS